MKILFDFAIFITMFSSTIAVPCDKPKKLTTSGETKGEYCASDHQICAFGIGEERIPKTDGQIRIGDVESNRFSFWRNINSEDGFACRIDGHGFGMDPYKDRPRTCQWREGPSDFEKEADKKITPCGIEGNSCSCPGQQARYGYNGGGDAIGERWTNWIDITDTFMCTWSQNGENGGFHFDPAHQRDKECQCRPTPTPFTIFQKYDGEWVSRGHGFTELKQTQKFTYQETESKTVRELFAAGISISATVGYNGGGVGAHASVTTEISASYEKEISQTIGGIIGVDEELECSVAACDDGELFQWVIKGIDQIDKVARAATCKFVCVPYHQEPVCPVYACDLKKNCTCARIKWSPDTDVDQKLCDDIVCSYTDGPNADNDGRVCDNWSGTLEEAKSRCTAESKCSYLHDWGDNGTGWRTCSAISVPGDGGAATKTKTCHNRRHLQDEGTAESAFDVSVDTATLSNIKLAGDTSRRRRLGGTKSAILLA